MIDLVKNVHTNLNKTDIKNDSRIEVLPFISYSQNLEDVMLWRALKNIKEGFYIDVGAYSSITHSVTAAFYERGWCGINIEPVSELFEEIAKARPRDCNIRLCVGSVPATGVFYAIPKTGLSTLSAEIAANHRAKGFVVHEEPIEIVPLAEICDRHAPEQIHFLKVDAEGAEHDVLAGANLVAYRPWIILVEATAPLSQDPTHTNWEYLLTQSGYLPVWFDGLNRFYIANEHQHLRKHFQTPPNIFDDFKICRDHAFAIKPDDATRA